MRLDVDAGGSIGCSTRLRLLGGGSRDTALTALGLDVK